MYYRLYYFDLYDTFYSPFYFSCYKVCDEAYVKENKWENLEEYVGGQINVALEKAKRQKTKLDASG